MQKLYSKGAAIILALIIFNSCTKETITREEYNPNIGIYGVWQVVFTGNDNIKDYQYLNFSNKKSLTMYLKNSYGFKSSFTTNFAPSSDQFLADIYNWGSTQVINYYMKGDTLMMENGGLVIAKSIKSSESAVAGWAEEVTETDIIFGLYNNRDQGIGFDGTNILLPDYGNTKVTKINLSTRLPNGSIDVNGTSYPYTAEFDGTDLWVSNNGWDMINKHPIAGGSITGTITVGAWVYGLAYDPASTNILAYSGSDDSLYVCNKNTNTVISTRAIGYGFRDMAWSNGKLFITRESYIYRINMTGFVIEKTYKLKSNASINGIAAVGNDFWLNVNGNQLIKVTLN